MATKKILFAVSEGFAGKWLPVCIAKALPMVESKFIGHLWSSGHFVRQEKYPYSYAPWQMPLGRVHLSMPNIDDLQIRHIDPADVPSSIRKSFIVLEKLIADELDTFKPDAVVYISADSSMGYLMDLCASQRGILSIGLQAPFLQHKALVHDLGLSWWQTLREAKMPAYSVTTTQGKSNRPAKMKTGYLTWLSRLERIARTLIHAPSFDTLTTLKNSLPKIKGAQLGYFPNLDTEDVADKVPDAFVLIALHRPILSKDQPDWLDLLRFALAAVPSHMTLVIRPHPNDTKREVPSDLLNSLRHRGARVSRPGKEADLPALLAKATALITLTSTIGIEALQAGVPTYTLCNAFYTRPGMAVYVDSKQPEVLKAQLNANALAYPNPELIAIFLNWLAKEYLAEMPEPSLKVRSADSIALRIRHLIAQHQSKGMNELRLC